MGFESVSNAELRTFLEALVTEALQKFRHEIVSIALFGSATTDEWVKGKSDVDFIVIVRNRDKRKEVDEFLNCVLLKLDDRLDMGLRETCSTYRKRRNPFLRFVDSIEDFFTFGRPFYVLSLDQVDFERARIDDFRIKVMSLMFNSTSIFAAKLKRTGATIYGDDFIQRLTSVPTRSDKIKAAMAPIWILLIAFATLPYDKSFSLRHAVKATVWACEDVLFAFDIPLSSTDTEFARLKELFSGVSSLSFEHLERTGVYKHNWPSTVQMNTFGRTLGYCLASFRFIARLYLASIRLSLFSDRQRIKARLAQLK